MAAVQRCEFLIEVLLAAVLVPSLEMQNTYELASSEISLCRLPCKAVQRAVASTLPLLELAQPATGGMPEWRQK